MTRVDFYVLEHSDERSRHTLACKLAEKAYRLENTVYIHARCRADAEQLDALLWTFRDGSFVPHSLSDAEGSARASPIVIGNESDGVEPRDLLINLDDEIPGFAHAFTRIAELVTADENCRRLSRRRFAAYREQGLDIQTHRL